ncbi:MAG: DUF3786 domain-containing protein [Lachnospiraceae bacterium]|nr:DUF3786 domain-containing protein [Lachnospiraceae bacterium]
MSINFHAYQCRGYLFRDYEGICKQWLTAFTNYDPARVMEILDLKRDDDFLFLTYFQRPFRLRLANGVLEKKLDESDPDIPADGVWSEYHYYEGGWTDRVYFNEAMSVYHLLSNVKDHPLLHGVWIPNRELDPRAIGNKREDLLCKTFAEQFAGKLDALDLACRKLNGKKLKSRADLSYEFEAFPRVALQLHFWDEDDEFPAQVQILVDRNITDFVHLETTGCMASDLFEILTDYQ